MCKNITAKDLERFSRYVCPDCSDIYGMSPVFLELGKDGWYTCPVCGCGTIAPEEEGSWKAFDPDLYERKHAADESMEQEARANECATDPKHEGVRAFYLRAYPDDAACAPANEGIRIGEVLPLLRAGVDFYRALGIGDSLVRERIFTRVAEVEGVDYDVIYTAWLRTA